MKRDASKPRQVAVRIARVIAGIAFGFAAGAIGATEASPDATATNDLPPVLTTGNTARFRDIFTPLQTDLAALSPDGRHLAYSYREGDSLSIVVVPIDNPGRALTKVLVGTDRQASGMMRDLPGDELVRLKYFGWVSPRRVALQTNAMVVFGSVVGWVSEPGQFFAFNLDGSDARLLATARDFVEVGGDKDVVMPVPRRFEVIDTEPGLADSVLLNVGRYTSGVDRNQREWEMMRISSQTGKTQRISSREATRQRATLAERAEQDRLAYLAVRRELEPALPRQQIEVSDSDATSARFLARVQSLGHPGSFHVFDRATRRSVDLIRCAPAVDTERIARTATFEATSPRGATLRGTITLPRKSRAKPYPLVVMCPSAQCDALDFRFRPEVLAFAEMGLAVLRLDLVQMEFPRRADSVPKSVAITLPDLLAGIDAALVRFPVHRKRVVLFAENTDAAAAIDFLLQAPGRFRAGITLTPDELWEWRPAAGPAGFDRSNAPPLLVLAAPGYDRRTRRHFQTLDYVSTYRNGGAAAELKLLPVSYNAGLPEGRAAAFVEMDEFLQVALYNYVVELGPLEEVKP